MGDDTPNREVGKDSSTRDRHFGHATQAQSGDTYVSQILHPNPRSRDNSYPIRESAFPTVLPGDKNAMGSTANKNPECSVSFGGHVVVL